MPFIDFINRAVYVGLISIEQVAKRFFRFPGFGSERATPGKMREVIKRFFKPVESFCCDPRFRSVYLKIQISQVASGAICKFNAICHAAGESH